MTSIRTTYRLKRINILADAIKQSAILLTEHKRVLERIHMKHFNLLQKTIAEIVKQANDVKSKTHVE
jgi:hypothetical protein